MSLSGDLSGLTPRKKRRRVRQLYRQLRSMERSWEKANRQYGLPPRPAIDAYYDKRGVLMDEIKELSRA